MNDQHSMIDTATRSHNDLSFESGEIDSGIDNKLLISVAPSGYLLRVR